MSAVSSLALSVTAVSGGVSVSATTVSGGVSLSATAVSAGVPVSGVAVSSGVTVSAPEVSLPSRTGGSGKQALSAIASRQAVRWAAVGMAVPRALRQGLNRPPWSPR